MNIRFRPVLIVVVAATLLSAATAYGQRGGGGSGRREGFDPADILKRMDENNNGTIETNEISNRSRSFVERAAERAKLDVSKPMPIDKLLPAMQANFEEFRQQQGGSRGPGSSTSSSTPLGSSPRPGFGTGARPTGGIGAPAAPVAVSSGLGAPLSRAGSIISLEARFDQSVIDYVNGDLLKRLDKNGDGSLDSVEWKANTWSKPPEESDLNKDGKLSREELCIRISKSRGIAIKGETATSSVGGSSPSFGPPGGPPGGLGGTSASPPRVGAPPIGRSSKGGSDRAASTTKKSYRFLTPTERLPKGMPDWFIKNDADGDGQIMMSEYAASYTESIAAEFAKYDVDGDGIITPNECLAGPKK